MDRRDRNLFNNPDLFDDQGIDSLVDSAYLDNLAKGQIVQSSREMGEVAVQTAIRNRGVQVPDWHDRVQHEVNRLLPDKRTSARHELIDSFNLYGHLYREIGLDMPSPEEFAGAGVNLVAQHNLWELQTSSASRPEYVITPHFELVNMWNVLYEGIAALRNKDLRLAVDSTLLDRLTNGTDRPRNSRNQPERTVGKHGIQWTIRVVSGRTHDAGPGANMVSSLSIAEYLSMQALRLYKDWPPLDDDQCTMVGVNTGREKIVGYYSDEENMVIIRPTLGHEPIDRLARGGMGRKIGNRLVY